MEAIARRKLMQGGAALAVAATVPLAAKAEQAEDAELRELWKQYLNQLDIYDEADRAASKARAAFDAEYPDDDPSFDHWKAHDWLWRKHGLHRLWPAVNREFRNLARIVKAIRKAKAESLFGVGVKLAAVEAETEEYDVRRANADALRVISSLTGEHLFAKVAACIKGGGWGVA